MTRSRSLCECAVKSKMDTNVKFQDFGDSNAKALLSEYKCAICLQILIEPVVLPCKHEMCGPCFRKNVEEANFLCPMCRKRIASWARKCIREGTLVDESRWKLIQKLFPDKCLKRLMGNDDESEDEASPPPKRVLAKSGELRQEYEEEMNKILQIHEEEEKASKDLIQNILEEEQTLQLEQENQEKDDEQLARKLSEDLSRTQGNNEGTLKTHEYSLNSPNVSKNPKNPKKLRERRKYRGRSYTLDRYFSSKGKQSGNSSGILSNGNAPDEELYTSDYELAMTLQKQFDQEAIDAGKRDDYMLRKTKSDNHNTHTFTKENYQQSKSCHEKQAGVAGKLLQVKGENILSDEKIKADSSRGEGKEIRTLCDRDTRLRRLDLSNDNHEL